ncbi:PadR family transcriptional regulator [Frigoribacterium sp. 2-23]|uniref:PadR family transcriptional regulator n=1 Tax=Frigoribacterium sp. 2-23 TaxID=3415006 RepID=UPI003C6EC4B7
MGTVHHHHENDQHEGNAGRFGRPFGRGFRPGGPGFGFGPGAGFGPGGPGFGFGPGRGGRGRARKGDVRLAILSLLADAPSNGYGLIKSIAERTDGAWKPSPGSVYPTLQQLVDEDLVSSDDTGAKTVFALTEAGRAFVTENGDAIAKAWAASTEGADDHDEFTTSVMKLVGVVKQFRFDGTEAQRAAAVEKLDETRRALYAILAD